MIFGLRMRRLQTAVQQQQKRPPTADDGSKEVRRDKLKLINKDFRVVTTDDIPEARFSRRCPGSRFPKT